VPLGAPVDVAVFTCAPSAELLVNGVSLGVAPTMGGGAAVWPRVPFYPGNLTAYAIDAGGARLGVTALRTAGAPAALRLYVESPYLPPRNGSVIAADGADVALLGVEVLDAAGVLCSQGAINITFAVQGPAAVYGVANGDPTDHAPVKGASWRRTYHGRARLLLASTGGAGAISVMASAPGVAPADAFLVAQ
jgi:beta-galactosidase